MVLKEYINFEKCINHELIQVCHFDNAISDIDSYSFPANKSLTLFLNIGNIIKITYNNESYIVPPKNAFLIYNADFTIDLNNAKNIKYSIINLKDSLNYFLKENLLQAVSAEYKHIFANGPYIFDFPLNIDILTLIEEIYKIDFSEYHEFDNLEIRAKSLYLIFVILKKILFFDYKYMDLIATSYTKYYAVLKNIFTNALTLQNSLLLYNMNEEIFNAYFSLYNPGLDLQEYINEHLEYEQL